MSVVFLLCLSFSAASAGGLDSLRLERRGGRQFVIHRVDQGETLYSISRRYGATVDQITSASGIAGTSVSVGQELSVPWAGAAPPAAVDEGYHTVEVGQTLYSISRQYNVSVDELKSWNNLKSNELSAGQQLIVKKGRPAAAAQAKAVSVSESSIPAGSDRYHTVAPSETLFSISRQYNVSVDDIKKWNDLRDNSLSVGQQLKIGRQVMTAPVAETPVREKKQELVVNDNGSLKQINKKGYTTDTASVGGYQKVVEEGFAMVIENSPETRKFLALHRTAPIGAILEVKNRMNGRSIYVRVVGKLPDTGANNKVLIRLSEKAFQRLEAIDPKVPVEVSYVP